MEFGAHLPLMTWGDEEPASLADLTAYARLANELGLVWLTSNDHLVYGRPWLDGPVALASVLPAIGAMTVATTIALPVVRGPGPLAKALAAIDRLSGGRLVVGVGPGSSERDYRAVGIAWEERWPGSRRPSKRFGRSCDPGSEPFEGAFYSTEGMDLLPAPIQPGGPPIWMGSWGSDVGLRRVARLADGWLASGYNTTPEAFGETLQRLHGHLRARGDRPEGVPNAVATMFLHLTEDAAAADDRADRGARAYARSLTRAAPRTAARGLRERVRGQARSVRVRRCRTCSHLAGRR